MNSDTPQDELAKEVFDIASETRGSDRYVVEAIGYQIMSNARLEESINRFSKSTAKTEKIMIALVVSQIIIAIGTLMVSFNQFRL